MYSGFSCELLVCGGFLCIFLVCDGFFIHIVAFKIIFSIKREDVYVWETCKNVWVLQVSFFNMIINVIIF